MSITMGAHRSAADGSGPRAEPAVEVEALDVDYGDGVVLSGVDLQVQRGEVLGLLGPSGCGKTTLLRAVAGFLRPARGTIRLAGRTVVGPGTFVAPERRNVGLVPQEGALFPHLDVAGNVGFGLSGTRRAGRSDRIAECLEMVGLPGSQRRRPGELSGGQQQRVALARALAPDPSVILLDEPFSALDAALRAQVREDVRDVLRTAGATAVLVTHDQEEALAFADRVAVLRSGRIAQVAAPETLYRTPVDLEVGTFVGESVTLRGELVGESVGTELGLLRTRALPGGAPRGEVRVLLRPEQIQMVPAGTSGSVDGVVDALSYFGHDAMVRLRLERTGTEVLCRTTRGDLPSAGDRVGLVVSGEVAVFEDRPDTGPVSAAAE